MKPRMSLSVLALIILVGFLVNQTPIQTLLSDNHNSLKTLKGQIQEEILESYGSLPLHFETNQGQADSQVKFISRGGGYSLFLTPTEAVLTLRELAEPKEKDGSPLTHGKIDIQSVKQAVLRMKLVGANPAPQVVGIEGLPGKVNYFLGNDPAKWITNVPTFAKVNLQDVYPGVDLVYYGNQGQLEYDFIVSPGADPNSITLRFEGIDRLEVNSQSDLVLHLGSDQVQLQKPFIYQDMNGVKQEIPGGYVIKDEQHIGFYVASYDAARPLIIDPVLDYSTYLGGSGAESARGIAVDSSGNAYVTGETQSTNFPTANAFQPATGGGPFFNIDAFVTKLNADGSTLVYSTYLGGSGQENVFQSEIAVDLGGNAFVTGTTDSTDFPTANPLQPSFAGFIDAFVAKLNPTGSALIYSTYLGGSSSEFAMDLAVDTSGNAYVTGRTLSTDFPTENPLQPSFAGFIDAFVAKLNPTGSALVYSTYLGGSGIDIGNGIVVGADGSANVTGLTQSNDFPTENAFQPTLGGGRDDIFVARLNPTGSVLIYSTYLGGSSTDENTSGGTIAVDVDGNAYVTGRTDSTDFPTANPLQLVKGGNFDAFVTKLNPMGSALIYSTYLGGSAFDEGMGIALDSGSNVYVTGQAVSIDFPTANAFQLAYGGGVSDGFVTKLNPTGSALIYSTYLGGSDFDFSSSIGVDSSGNAYVAGGTNSADFPITPGVFQAARAGSFDAFIAKIALSPCVIDSLTLAGIPVGDVSQDALSDVTAACNSNNLVEIAPNSIFDANISLGVGEVLVVEAGAVVNGNIKGDGTNTVILGDNAQINGNVSNIGQLFVGGTNVFFDGNYRINVKELIIGPGADLHITGNVEVDRLVIESGGSLHVGGNLLVKQELTLGANASLQVDGGIECSPGTTVTKDPTATVIILGTNQCSGI